MSVHIASRVWRYPIPAIEKIVLLKLADCADDNGRNAFPSVARMARECGASERHVRNVLRKYRDTGLLKIQKAADAGAKRPNMYAFDLKVLAAGVNDVQGCTAFRGAPGASVPLHTVPLTPARGAPKPSVNRHKNRHGASTAQKSFDDFWREYPSRAPHSNPKKPARAKFDAAVKRGTEPADIIRGARNYAAYVEQEAVEPRFVKQATTWLNQECWSDYQDEPKPKGSSRGLRL